MPRKATPLTAVGIRNAKPDDYPLWDGQGLHLHRDPSGARQWRLKYRRPDGRENRIGLGGFPDVDLKSARAAREKARELIRDGRDPVVEKRANKARVRHDADAAFPAVAAAWLAFKRKSWAAETHRKAQFVVDEYLAPKLRRTSISTLSTKDAADAIATIAETVPTLAAKARQYVNGIVRYAIRHGLRADGTMLELRDVVPTYDRGHIAAATTPEQIAELLKAVDQYDSTVTRHALLVAMLTAMRPGVVASARWAEIDLDAAEWHVPAERMKTGHAHIAPLPRQAVALLRAMQQFSADREYVFPPLARQKTPHLHRDALSNALRRMGLQGKHSTHGFRAMLRTAGRERLGIDPDVLEAQLAHAKKGEVAKAYDRTSFGDARRKAMQRWADYLDQLRAGGSVTPIRSKRSAAKG